VKANIEDVVSTRATATAFEAKDEIGISVASGQSVKTTGVNIRYTTTDGSAFNAADKPIYFLDGKTTKFTAYYPYDSSVTADNPAITKSTSSQTEADRKTFDFLFSEDGEGNVNSKDGITMTFKHKMSKLTFTIVAGTGAKSDEKFVTNLGATYAIDGLVLDGTFNTSTGEAAPKSDATSTTLSVSVPSAASGTTVPTTEASTIIVYPQTPAAVKVTLTYNGVKYTASAKVPTDGYEAGKNYKYQITLNQTSLTVSKASIDDWEPVSGENTSAEYEYPDDIYNGSDASTGLPAYSDESDLQVE
jgi:hypothetical protein